MEITIKTDAKNNAKGLTIKGAYAYFTRIKTPQNVWADKDKPLSQNPEREFKTTLLVNKDVAKEWNKAFKKSKTEAMDVEETLSRLKLKDVSELPFEAEEYFVVTLKQSEKKTVYKPDNTKELVVRSGKERPQVAYQGKVVTFTTLVGNGSEVTVTGTASTNPQYGTFPYLDKMLVTELVEVGGSGMNAEVFGDIDFSNVEEPEDNESVGNFKQSDDDSDVPNDLPEDDEAPFDLDEEDY